MLNFLVSIGIWIKTHIIISIIISTVVIGSAIAIPIIINNMSDDKVEDKWQEEKQYEVEKPQVEVKQKYHKSYEFIRMDDGRKATLKLQSDNKCELDFTKFNKVLDLGDSEYLRVKYNKGICVYEKENDKDFVIKYTGTFDAIHTVSQLSTYGKFVFQTENQEIKISFTDDDYNSFKITNGEWDFSWHTLYFKDKNSSISNNSSNSNNDSNSNDSSSNSSNNDNSNNNNSIVNKTWGNWTSWSTIEVIASETREVETKKTEIKTNATIYKYKHFICPNATATAPKGNATPYEDSCSGGYWENIESDYIFSSGTGSGECNYYHGGFYDHKKYSSPNTKETCWFEDGTKQGKEQTSYITEYRYRDQISR